MEKINAKQTIMIPIIQNFKTVVLAHGDFPTHKIPLSFLHNAERIICCDGATINLLKAGLKPDYIVGDLDSLPDKVKEDYQDILHYNPDQETNDLSKAISFCSENGWKEITILSATGKREDHSLGNISLLANYAATSHVQLLTDYGVFVPMLISTGFESVRGQQVSIFSLTPKTVFTTQHLRYPLNERTLQSWWEGTLNEALGNNFEIKINHGKAIIFREYQI